MVGTYICSFRDTECVVDNVTSKERAVSIFVRFLEDYREMIVDPSDISVRQVIKIKEQFGWVVVDH